MKKIFLKLICLWLGFKDNKKKLVMPLMAVTLALALLGGLHGTADAGSSMVSGIDSLYDPLMMFLYQITFALVTGLAYLYITSHVLQWIVSNPQWVDMDSVLVRTGLQMTTGLADMLLIVVFMAIAFSFIFKIDNIDTKKALPKFFAAAILVHFAPLGVKMVVDVANIVNNTIVLGSENTITDVFDSLCGQIVQSLWTLLKFFVGEAAGVAIGGVSDVVKIVTVGLLGTVFLPFLPIYISQIILAFGLGGILVMYIIFFLSRIYMLQFIAIVSPLAVLAWVLPNTESIYKKVFDALMKWAFVGTMVLFLLVLGLRSADAVVPGGAFTLGSVISSPGSFLGLDFIFNMQGYLIYYLFLFIYMTVVAYIVEQNMPVMGNALKSSFMGIGGLVAAQTVKPAFGGIQRRTGMLQERLQAAASAPGADGMDRVAAYGAGLLNKGLGGIGGAAGSKTGLEAFTAAGTGASMAKGYSSTKEIDSKADEYKKNVDMKDTLSKNGIVNETTWNRKTDIEQAAIMKAYADKPAELKALKKVIGEEAYQRDLDRLAQKGKITKDTLTKHLSTASVETVQNVIMKNGTLNMEGAGKVLLPDGRDNDEVKRMDKLGYKGDEAIKRAGESVVMKSIVQSLKKPEGLRDTKVGEMIEKNPELREAFLANTDASTLGKAWNYFTPEQQKLLQEDYHKMAFGKMATMNPQLLTQPMAKILGPREEFYMRDPETNEVLKTKNGQPRTVPILEQQKIIRDKKEEFTQGISNRSADAFRNMFGETGATGRSYTGGGGGGGATGRTSGGATGRTTGRSGGGATGRTR